MHILIAEDHPDLRKILTLYLQKEGYQVSVVSNGQEAITYLMERCGLKKEAKNNLGLTFSKSPSSHAPATLPDLLILDWMMPVQDGIQTCREMEKQSMKYWV